jgi:5-methylcytosine-specific restriction endonuclease McrA
MRSLLLSRGQLRHREYLRSPEWQELRSLALERDLYCCRLCGSRNRLHVHHRWYPRPWRLDSVDALTTLCQRCHKKFHGQPLSPNILWLGLIALAVLAFWIVTL